MADPEVPRDPVPEVYVLWHPRCAFGEIAARAIYDWLRPGNGVGPQVFYRCLPRYGGPPGGRPLELTVEARRGGRSFEETANLHIVLPLIDENMVADPTWRHWLTTLEDHHIPRHIVPVALDASAFNVPSPIRERNFLRPVGGNDEDRIRALLKQLTEALCTMLLGSSRAGTGPELGSKIKIFLSHAKVDGAGPARRIRDHIYSQTQIAAFYDENDIPFGSAFATVLEQDLESRRTVALIAVRSAQYAHRPWCRRELSVFRRPVEIEKGSNRWRLNPVVVVDAIADGALTPGIPELGNAPIMRWDAARALEEQIVTMLLRDALLAQLHASVGCRLPTGPREAVINWLPDPISMLPILRAAGESLLTIHHPGHSLSALELDVLDDLFPHVAFVGFEGV
jgi:hypothetical protein